MKTTLFCIVMAVVLTCGEAGVERDERDVLTWDNLPEKLYGAANALLEPYGTSLEKIKSTIDKTSQVASNVEHAITNVNDSPHSSTNWQPALRGPMHLERAKSTRALPKTLEKEVETFRDSDSSARDTTQSSFLETSAEFAKPPAKKETQLKEAAPKEKKQEKKQVKKQEKKEVAPPQEKKEVEKKEIAKVTGAKTATANAKMSKKDLKKIAAADAKAHPDDDFAAYVKEFGHKD